MDAKDTTHTMHFYIQHL